MLSIKKSNRNILHIEKISFFFQLTKLSNFEEAVILLSKLSKDLHLNLSEILTRRNESRPKQTIQNVDDLWTVLSPLLCGTQRGKSSSNGKDTGSKKKGSLPELLHGGSDATKALRIMLYVLSNDPMILYSPNGTDADKVIRKVRHSLNCVLKIIFSEVPF